MEKITSFGGITRLNVSADKVLTSAVGQLDEVIISGFDKEGELYFASSVADGGDALWLVEKFKNALLNQEVK